MIPLLRAKTSALSKARRNLFRAAGPVSLLETVQVPKRMLYYSEKDQREIVERFLGQIEYFLGRGGNVHLDFSNLETLYPCGLLILMGAVDDWVLRFPGRLSANYPQNDREEQMLQHVGVLQKLDLKARKVISHNDVKRWHYFTGTNVDASPFEPFMEEVRSIVGEEVQVGLASCVNEAMTNVKQHAYRDGAAGWWIFATISDKRIFVAMHDRGASIPATLLEKPEIGDILKARLWRGGKADGQLISAAAGGRTSTKLEYRGKGLPEMLQFTKESIDGDFAIYSRNGYFRFNTRQHVNSVGRLTKPITGTLIAWALNLPKAKI
jgi:hypothetical protein